MVNILGVGHYVLALVCGLLTALSRCARGGGVAACPTPAPKSSTRPGAVAVIRH
ncbi:hypothetical protein PF007_g17425 [Phytophthora fragariae]|uniref:RxLR effector protein n=1 Tax=Phytophthora fragariae TaxID=53985 RepID=A0A6A3REB6_9STRA|nr:hypothetical protein PF003_g618 [Phytophthora fragariae]KAE9095315.1 hypothetical protein PF007_g17425 [Phytophthora fragariae]KAE9209900.1 hypothetical protein PF004_g16336 [Phytophthora fragariae]